MFVGRLGGWLGSGLGGRSEVGGWWVGVLEGGTLEGYYE